MDILFDVAFLSGFAALILTYVVCIVSPGPDFAVIVRNSLMYSRRSGVFTAIGSSTGMLFHAAYTLVGVALLIKSSAWGFTIVKGVGAAYLVYIGVQSFRTKNSANALVVDKSENDISRFAAFRHGFFTNALNPMAMMFFVTMFSMVITDTTPHVVKFFYASSVYIVGLAWFSLVAVCFSHVRVQDLFSRLGHWVGRITGGVMVSLGVRLVFMAAP